MGTSSEATGSPAGEVEGRAVATFGGGCFWCTEAVFSELQGVHRVLPGYAGGRTRDPTYEEVCSGNTGHAEVVRIEFDPAILSYADALRIFFTTHDPTTKDRQGADVGTQYRSIVLVGSPEEGRLAEAIRIEAEEIWGRPVLTEIVPLDRFYPAEEYHRDYFRRNPGSSYCQAVIAPKVAKFRKSYADRLRRSPE